MPALDNTVRDGLASFNDDLDMLKMSRGEWDLVVYATEEILASSPYPEAHTAVGGELLREGTLSADRVL
jgi:hypothetical protein